jgi:hypothetical protein
MVNGDDLPPLLHGHYPAFRFSSSPTGPAAEKKERRSAPMTTTALITGATSGIGRAAANKLAQSDIHVMVVGRNVERGEKKGLSR